MAILNDPARWPAHGTVFSHLVSDESLEELHAFARATGVPPNAFDGDHYDVPVSMYETLIAAGAQEVTGSELVRRLVKSGLRITALSVLPSWKKFCSNALIAYSQTPQSWIESRSLTPYWSAGTKTTGTTMI